MLLLLPLVSAAGPAATVKTTKPAASSIDLSFPGRDPSLAWDREGRLHAVWVEGAGESARVLYRRLDPPSKAVTLTPPGVSTSAHGETPPLLAALPDGTLVAAYTVPMPGKWQAEVRLQRSTDGGAHWSPPVPLMAGGDRGSHNEIAAAVTSGGHLVLAWLDKRAESRGLRTARSRDGLRFEADRTLDGKTCECCGNAVLAGPRGEVWIAYRDVEETGVRDFALARSRDEGASFGNPRPLYADRWKIDGCPHTGARLALDRDGGLWATWFTGESPGIYAARSKDGGARFAPRQLIAEPGKDTTLVTHPEIGVLPDGRIAILYEAVRTGGARDLEVRLRAPKAETWSAPAVIATSASYPRLAVREGRAAVAFTRQQGESTQVVVRSWERMF